MSPSAQSPQPKLDESRPVFIPLTSDVVTRPARLQPKKRAKIWCGEATGGIHSLAQGDEVAPSGINLRKVPSVQRRHLAQRGATAIVHANRLYACEVALERHAAI